MSLKLNRSVRLAVQVSIINVITILLAMTLLILSLNSLYKREENALAREKLTLIWSEILGNDSLGFIRNIYLRDRQTSRASYGIRIADKSNKTLLLEFPNAWLKYSMSWVDFEKSIDLEKPYRLEVIQGNRKYSTNIDVYSLSLGSYYVQVLVSVEERINFLVSLGKRSLPIALGIILLSFFIAIVTINRILIPVNNINKIVEEIIEKQTINQRLEEIGKSEFARLQKNFNIMLNVIERQVNRLKQATINIGHDIRTPLTRVSNKLEEALNEDNVDIIKERLEESLLFLEDINLFTKQVLDLSEIDSGLVHVPKEPVNISKVLENVIDMYVLVAEEKGVKLQIHIDETLELYIDKFRLIQLVGNLLNNAIKFTSQEKEVQLDIYKRDLYTTIKVRDQGIGIEEHDIENIWVPSWKKIKSEADMERSSYGFGLSIVESIVQAYQGNIMVKSQLGQGTEFVIKFKDHEEI